MKQYLDEEYYLTDEHDLIFEHCGDVKILLEQSYWANNRKHEIVERSITNSLCFAVFHEKSEKLVAFSRVVTDYATMYYLCDVIVDQMHRGKNIGKKMVEWITTSESKLSGKYGMLLTKDAQGLYSKYGFEEYDESCMCKFK